MMELLSSTRMARYAACSFFSGGSNVHGFCVQSVKTGNVVAPRDIVRTVNYIGESAWAADGSLHVEMQDLRIYDYVLPEQDVLDVYNL